VKTLAAGQKAFGADWTTALTRLPVGELDYPKKPPGTGTGCRYRRCSAADDGVTADTGRPASVR
jgi:hypothetical protein